MIRRSSLREWAVGQCEARRNRKSLRDVAIDDPYSIELHRSEAAQLIRGVDRSMSVEEVEILLNAMPKIAGGKFCLTSIIQWTLGKEELNQHFAICPCCERGFQLRNGWQVGHTPSFDCSLCLADDQELQKIRSLRDAVRAGAGIYWDFLSGSAKRGRTWHPHAPEQVRAALCRDCNAEELQRCREVTGIDKAKPAPAGTRPKVLIILGPSGSGKSMVLPLAARLFDVDLSAFALVDGDDLRSCHSGWKSFVVENTAANYFDAYDIFITNKKNKDLKKVYTKECLRERKPVVFPWTNIEQSALDIIQAMDYEVYLLGMLISCAESDCRQKNRAEVNGRWASTTMKKWSETIEHLLRMCQPSISHRVIVFDTTDLLNMQLLHVRGVPGVDDPGNLHCAIEELKTDAQHVI